MQIDLLGVLSFIADLAPLVLLVFYYKLLKQKINIILFIWTIISVALDILVIYLPNNKIQDVAFYSMVLEPFFVLFIYFGILKKKKQKFFMLGSILVYFFVVLYHYFNYKMGEFPNLLAASSVFIVLLNSILMFVFIFKDTIGSEISMIEYPFVFIFVGYIVYTSGVIFLFAAIDEFPNIFKEAGLWRIFLIANILKNVFLVKYLFDSKNKLTSKS